MAYLDRAGVCEWTGEFQRPLLAMLQEAGRCILGNSWEMVARWAMWWERWAAGGLHLGSHSTCVCGREFPPEAGVNSECCGTPTLILSVLRCCYYCYYLQT